MITVADVIEAQIRSIEHLDKSKNCGSCKNENSKRCEKCINSFMGIYFTPSEYEAKAAEAKEQI
jgi:hypothetical protein